MEAKDIEDVLDLVLKGTELAGPLANSYWLLTEVDPARFKGFMGFVSNPAALQGGFTSGVITTTTTVAVKAVKDLDDLFAGLRQKGKVLDSDVLAGLSDIYNGLRSLIP